MSQYAYEQWILQYGPDVYYPLVETSGTTTFDIANGKNANPSSNITLGSSPILANGMPCYKFNNNGGIIINYNEITDLGTHSGNFQYSTIQLFWIECTSVPSAATLFYINGYEVQLNPNGTLTSFYRPNGTGQTHGTTINLFDGNPHLIMAQCFRVVSAFQLYNTDLIYIDGNIQPFGYVAWNGQDVQTLTQNGIGCNGNSTYFKGKISNFAVFGGFTSIDLLNTYIAGQGPYLTNYETLDTSEIVESATPPKPIHLPLPNDLIDASISSQIAEQPNNRLLYSTFPNEVLANDLIETLRLDLYKWMQQQGLCPPNPPPPILIFSNGGGNNSSNLTVLTFLNSNFFIEYYYRTPISLFNSIDGQPVSKYDNLFNKPYIAIAYPSGDIYANHMLVKTNMPLSIVPLDVVQVSKTDVATDLLRIVSDLYAV